MPETHPDVDVLADLHAGTLPGDREAEVRTHVAGCVDCSDLLGRLSELQDLLSDVPAEPMPDDVVARIDTTLAEARRQSDVGPVTPLRPHRRWVRPLAAAAVTVGALSLAVPAWNSVQDGGGVDDAQTAADARGESAESGPTAVAGGLVFTSDNFAAEVQSLAVNPREYLAAAPNAMSEEARSATCGRARARLISFDGEPAFLRLERRAGRTEAVAYRCDDKTVVELARAPIKSGR